MAPECLSRKYGRPAFASDVYSVGVILWELWAKRRVYTGFRNLEENVDKAHFEETGESRVDVKLVAKRMASGGQRPELPAECPVLWSLLMQACWEAAIDARPTFPQVLAVLTAMAADPSWAEPPPADEAEPPAQAAAEAEPVDPREEYAAWLASIGLQAKEDAILCYLSVGSPLKDIKQMDDEDMKDMLDDEGIDAPVRPQREPLALAAFVS